MNDASVSVWPLLIGQQSSLVDLDLTTIVKWALWLLVGFFGVFPGIVAYMVWAERKVAARFQDRIGPNRVGPLGLLQPIADALKLITKESIVPRTADQFVHILAPVLILVSAFLVLAVIPFGAGLAPVNLPSGMVYLVAVSSLSPLGIFLAGWSSRNKYSLLGAMRSVAQLVSYEVPQVLATIPVVLWAGSLSLVTIFERQADEGWYIFSPPGLLSFVILLITSLAEVNRTPFDLPEAESEIIAGYHTEYSGMRFGLFFLAEYMSVFGVSCLGTVLFLGGGLVLPISDFPLSILGTTYFSYSLVNAILLAAFTAKVFLFIFLMFWVRATLPRMRVDRLMNFAWKFMIPLAIANVLIAALWFELVLRPGVSFGAFWPLSSGMVKWLVGWLVTGPITLGLVWFVIWFNKQVRSTSEEFPSVTHSRPASVSASSPVIATTTRAGRSSACDRPASDPWMEVGRGESEAFASGGWVVLGSESSHVIQSLFVVISLVGLLAALGTVLARNLVHAALYLVAFFFIVACQFVLLEAEFLAAIQVLVYIGAVSILMMFGIMLTRNVQGDDTTSVSKAWTWPALVATLGLFFVLVFGVNNHVGFRRRGQGVDKVTWSGMLRRPTAVTSLGAPPSARAAVVNDMGRGVGDELVTRYSVAFETAGLMLTAALVGAVALAHRDREDDADDRRAASAARTLRNGPRGEAGGDGAGAASDALAVSSASATAPTGDAGIGV